MNREKIYKVIDSERNYQDKKWGSPESKDYVKYPSSQFLIDIEKHLSDAKTAQYQINEIEVKEQIRKIAALCVKFGEVHGLNFRNDYR